MSTASSRFGTTILHNRVFLLLVFAVLTSALHADQVQMQNGDRYFGKITTLNTNSLILQSEVLGSVQLPRSKVATIILGTNVMNNVAQAAPATTPNITPETPASIRQLAA